MASRLRAPAPCEDGGRGSRGSRSSASGGRRATTPTAVGRPIWDSIVTDTLSRLRRSALMASVKGRGNAPERIVRSYLHQDGMRFAHNPSRLPGRPDIVLPGRQSVVFVHGCFWHGHPGCSRAALPKTNTEWWRAKVARNRARDRKAAVTLRNQGWHVFIVWTCSDMSPGRLAELAAAIRGLGRFKKEPTGSRHYRLWESRYGT
jgi:DNA mismatch endonuclease (patch repair protein)